MEAPQQWFVCDACNGSGVEVFGIWVYEPGCGFGHDSTDERPCGKCAGAGGWPDDAEPDEPHSDYDTLEEREMDLGDKFDRLMAG